MANNDENSIHSIPVYFYKFDVPKTQKLSFESVLKNIDPQSQEKLKQISGIREELKSVLDGESLSQAVQVIEKYMPSFFGLMQAAEKLPPEVSKNLRIIWSTPLGLRNSTNPFVSSSWRWEVVMVLLGYGIVLRNQAIETLKSTGLGTSSVITNPQEFDEKSKTIANLLTKAAGIFNHITEQQLSKWTIKPDSATPEIFDECFLALSSICIAEASEITIRKGLLKGTGVATLAKLAIDVSQRFEYASSLLAKLKNTPAYGSWPPEVQPAVLSYLSIKTQLWKGITYKLLAEDAYNNAKYGVAVAFMEAASASVPKRNAEDARLEQLLSLYNTERTSILNQLAKYTQENEKIYYALVQTEDVVLPEAKCLMKPASFQQPEAATIEIVASKGSDCIIQ